MDTRLENRGRWRRPQKGNYKKQQKRKNTPRSKAAPGSTGQVFLEGEQWAVWAVLVLSPINMSEGWSPTSGDTVPSAGYIQRCFLTFRRCSCSKKVLLPGRSCQVGWAVSGIPNLKVSPQLSRRTLSQLTMAPFPSGSQSCLWKNSLGLEKEGPG